MQETRDKLKEFVSPGASVLKNFIEKNSIKQDNKESEVEKFIALKAMEEVENKLKYKHYFKEVGHLQIVDVYRVLQLFEVTDHCIGQAIKKLLASGKRGVKTEEQDIDEAIDLLKRRKQMIHEDKNKLIEELGK